MLFTRNIILVSLLAILFPAAPALAADTSGLWLATVAVNRVGEVNQRVKDSIFDLALSATQPSQPLIGKGSSDWKYYDNGTLPPNWQTSSIFANWSSGRAPLGFKAGSGTFQAPSGGTKISFTSYSSHNILTTYFQKTFNLADHNTLSTLKLKLWFNDAIQVFLNGASIYTNNVTADWSFVSAGAKHTVALRADGSLWAWGLNDQGQLGDGTTTFRNSPTRVIGSNFIAVAAGRDATAAIKSDGSLWTWGSIGSGQLGYPSVGDVKTPSQVGTGLGWASVSAGEGFFLAIRKDGSLWGWGANDQGKLGLGTSGPTPTPTLVSSGPWSVAFAGGTSSAGIKSDGTLWTWGDNVRGQLGTGSGGGSRSPVQVGDAASRWQSVSMASYHCLAVKKDGTLWSWGDSRNVGLLGQGVASGAQRSPVQVGSDTDWSRVSAGYNLSLAIKNDGGLWGWGSGCFGENNKTPILQPKRLGLANDWLQVSTLISEKGDRVYALRGSGSNVLWGWSGNSGYTGDGTSNIRLLMAELPSFYSAVKAKAGDPAASYTEVSIPVSAVGNGDNSIAVEVYGAPAANPSLYFDLDLTGNATDPAVLIGAKSAGWSYNDAATTDPADWKTAASPGGTWSSGAAPLGFGRSADQLATTVNNVATSYYRKTVTVASAASYKALNLSLLRDDGAVVYLNGTEILRSNMPAGAIFFRTPPLQIIGPVGEAIYQNAGFALPAGLLKNGDNLVAVEIHQHPAELVSGSNLAGLTPTGADFPLRLLLHDDGKGGLRLLKEAIVMKDSSTNTGVVLADSSLVPGYSGIVRRNDALVGLRISAIGYDFSGSSITCNGALDSSGSAECDLTLLPGNDSNPFLHRFHPDHDNLDEHFTTVLTGTAAESYQVARKLKLTFSNRYPANPDEIARDPSSVPPGWGDSQLGGTYGETLTGLHKDTLSTSGWFTLKRLTGLSDLRQ